MAMTKERENLLKYVELFLRSLVSIELALCAWLIILDLADIDFSSIFSTVFFAAFVTSIFAYLFVHYKLKAKS